MPGATPEEFYGSGVRSSRRGGVDADVVGLIRSKITDDVPAAITGEGSTPPAPALRVYDGIGSTPSGGVHLQTRTCHWSSTPFR